VSGSGSGSGHVALDTMRQLPVWSVLRMDYDP
jgi:hypothetical protein